MEEKEIRKKIKQVEAGNYDLLKFLKEVSKDSKTFETYLNIQLRRGWN